MSEKCCSQAARDIYFADRNTEGLHQPECVIVGASRCPETGHGYPCDTCARQPEFVECADGNQQSQRRVEASRNADDG